MANDALAVLAEDVLVTLAGRLSADGITVPERQYVSVGSVAHECELWVVSFERAIATGIGGAQAVGPPNSGVLRTNLLACHLIRCVPTSEKGYPSAAELDAWGIEAMTDAWALMRNVIDAYKSKELSACDALAITGIEAVGPQGGFGGVVMRLQIGL